MIPIHIRTYYGDDGNLKVSLYKEKGVYIVISKSKIIEGKKRKNWHVVTRDYFTHKSDAMKEMKKIREIF